MKYNFSIRVCFLFSFFVMIGYLSMAQCNVSFCGNPVLNSDAPVYNAVTNSIDINNLTFGNIGCSLANKQLGVDVYVYQILPDNTKATLCNVLDVAPENVVGYARINLGNSNICGNTFNIGTIVLNNANGFNICDGTTYEVEMALFATNNTSFFNSEKTVYSLLPTSEYLVENLGQIDIDILNVFPGNGQPLILNEISDWTTRSSGGITVPCNSDVELFLQGQSLLGNCFPYDDYTVAITSELVNLFTYSINGAPPIVVENSSTGTSDGQTSGPAQNNGDCYGGILTNAEPYVFEASNVANPCNTSVEFKMITFDIFTNQNKESIFTVTYSNNCVNNLVLNNTILGSGTYRAGQTITSNASLINNGIVNFYAASEIALNNGFTVNSNNEFLAHIEPCQ